MPFKVFRISEEDFNRALKMYRGLSGEVDRAVSDLATEEKTHPAFKENELSSLDLDDPSIGKREYGTGRGIFRKMRRPLRLFRRFFVTRSMAEHQTFI